MSSQSEIIDYAQKDFRTYWQGTSKELLHDSEEKIVQSLMTVKSRWFIDIGCGFGRLMPLYQSGKDHLVLLDYDVKHLKMAADATSRKNVHYIAADACNLPFRDEVFDGGVCVRLCHHISKPENLMHELYRVFRNSSSLVFNYMNRRSVLRIFRYGRDCFRHTHEAVSEIIFATHPAYYSDVATAAGFSIQSVRGTGLVHQMVHDNKGLARCAERYSFLSRLLSLTELLADPVLGRLNLALMQYTRLEKGKSLVPAVHHIEPGNLMDILRCPNCGSLDLDSTHDGVQCPRCEACFRKDGPVFDFRCNREVK